MTKFILIGGYRQRTEDGGKKFAEELVAGFAEPVKILDCMFAGEENTWQEKFEKDIDFFTKHLPNTTTEIELANPKDFLKQVLWADAIFIRGGKTEHLMKELEKQGGWEKELNRKTVAGSSAGAHAISKYFYKLDGSGEIGKGLDLLPVKVIVHYQSDYNAPNIDWDDAYKVMNEYETGLETVTLREGEFKVFKK